MSFSTGPGVVAGNGPVGHPPPLPGGRNTAQLHQYRVNHQIRVPEVRLIDENGEQVGVVPTEEALRRADVAGLDLVEVAPAARPPVCKIMDYGKFKYQMKKREHEQRKRTTGGQLKEIRVRPKIDKHDLDFKLARAREFLAAGNKVQFNMLFRGREMAHQDVGRQVMARIVEDLADVAKVERPARMEGRRMTLLLTRLK